MPSDFISRLPLASGSPADAQIRSFSRKGTPRNGPLGSSGERAAARAFSNSGVTTAFKVGFTFSIRSIAASTSSIASASPSATSFACAPASSRARSSVMSARLSRVVGGEVFGPVQVAQARELGVECAQVALGDVERVQRAEQRAQREVARGEATLHFAQDARAIDREERFWTA